jgi:hypothetical protein
LEVSLQTLESEGKNMIVKQEDFENRHNRYKGYGTFSRVNKSVGREKLYYEVVLFSQQEDYNKL